MPCGEGMSSRRLGAVTVPAPPRLRRNLSIIPAFSRARNHRETGAWPGPEAGMSEAEFERRMAELDRLLNDPDVPMDPDRIWTLLAEISRRTAPPPRG